MDQVHGELESSHVTGEGCSTNDRHKTESAVLDTVKDCRVRGCVWGSHKTEPYSNSNGRTKDHYSSNILIAIV